VSDFRHVFIPWLFTIVVCFLLAWALTTLFPRHVGDSCSSEVMSYYRVCLDHYDEPFCDSIFLPEKKND